MVDRWVRRLRTALVAGCCLACCVACVAGATAAGRAAGRAGPGLRVLQLNLCDSGLASCYTGRSVTMAAAVIRRERPGVVTLNEVCRGDVLQLEQAMSETYRGSTVAAAFKAAEDRPLGGPYRCRNGQQYGIGVLAVLPSSAARYRISGGVYPVQDRSDPEERVWLCIHAATAFYGCTTHAASTSAAIALAQCRYFFRSAVPRLRSRGGGDPVVLGADLNLPASRTPGPQSCLPGGYQRADDGSRQEVIISRGLAIRSRAIIDMHGTTDHPALVVELSRPSG